MCGNLVWVRGWAASPNSGGQRRTCAVPTICPTSRRKWWARFALPTLQEGSSVPRARLEGRDDVLAGDDSDQLLGIVEHDDAPDAVLDHDLEYARQPRVGTDIDELRRHDVADLAAHQVVIAR